MINRIVPMASPFGNYFAVRRDFGCGEDPIDTLPRERNIANPDANQLDQETLAGLPGSVRLRFAQFALLRGAATL
jgi:hypothetical protein